MPYQLPASKNKPSIVHFFYRFIAWLAFAQLLLWGLKTNTSLIPNIQNTLAWIAGKLYALSGKSVIVIHNILLSPTTGHPISIDLPCLGLDMCAAIVALQLAMRTTWTVRLKSICFGIVLLQLYNCVRITHLLSIAGTGVERFNFYHLFVWQTGNLVFLVSLIFVIQILFHHDRSIINSIHKSRHIKAIAKTTMLTPLLFISNAFGFGGGGVGSGNGSSGSGSTGGGGGVPFFEMEPWQYGLWIAILFAFVAASKIKKNRCLYSK